MIDALKTMRAALRHVTEEHGTHDSVEFHLAEALAALSKSCPREPDIEEDGKCFYSQACICGGKYEIAYEAVVEALWLRRDHAEECPCAECLRAEEIIAAWENDSS